MPSKTRTRASETRKQILIVAAIVTGTAVAFGGLGAFAVDRYTTDRVCTDMVELATGEVKPQTEAEAQPDATQLADLREELDRTESRLLFNSDLRTAVQGFSADMVQVEQVVNDMARFTTVQKTGQTTTEKAQDQVDLVKNAIAVLRSMDSHVRQGQVACGQVPVGIPAVQEQLSLLNA
ncbi:hypothetical protein FB565_000503 [Actinoplanes lutulentus]|uniref:Uncharacterized protein n=1 Tax=Actinoplanes lutulentus TaxID=1287878 RepID=A0A327ZKC2_9ACTN|nr:hypothetical protein [Actinoplanes lutulentus]MBB2940799.1 hypothetical protein [Actinoplanes lutulentus]RAK43109.1 hypothetical protein B0I29_101239 [Actinoplanes lutulentus]